MSMHTSLAKKGLGAAHRNVLKKFERILRLQAEHRWDNNEKALGMPKIKSIKLKKK